MTVESRRSTVPPLQKARTKGDGESENMHMSCMSGGMLTKEDVERVSQLFVEAFGTSDKIAFITVPSSTEDFLKVMRPCPDFETPPSSSVKKSITHLQRLLLWRPCDRYP